MFWALFYELYQNKCGNLGFKSEHYVYFKKLKKFKPTKFGKFFWFFTNFQLKLWDLYLPRGTIVMADFYTTNTTFQALQDRIPFGRVRDTCVFLGETPWNRTAGIIRFFAITQEGVDQSFSSSNSTEISIRRFNAQNFITIGLPFVELSCIRTAGHTDRFYSVLTFWVHKNMRHLSFYS